MYAEPLFSSLVMKPAISYTCPILQGILCLIMYQEVNWEEEFKYRQIFFIF